MQQVIVPVVTLIGYFAVVELAPDGGLLSIVFVAVATLLAFLFGRRLSRPIRLFITGVILHFTFLMCLVGRTYDAGLTGHTITWAIIHFSLYAFVPCLSLLWIWQRRLAIWLIAASFPACLTLASIVATVEEFYFVRSFPEGSDGMRPRWTITNHGLCYDGKELRGTD